VRIERRALHGVRVDGGERGVVDLARPDADHPLNGLDEDLPVADFAGAGGSQDALMHGSTNGSEHTISIFTFSWNSMTTVVRGTGSRSLARPRGRSRD